MEIDGHDESIKLYTSIIKAHKTDRLQDSQSKLKAVISNLSRTNKFNSLMHFYLSNISLVPSELPIYTINSQLNFGELSLFELNVHSCSFIQSIMLSINFCINEPEDFVNILDRFYSKPTEEITCDASPEYVGFCLLPSFFAFFSIPDLLPFASRLAINLISFDSLTKLSEFFSASYFINTPKFIDFLWEDYFNSFICFAYQFQPMEYFNNFLISLQKATRFLTSHHFLVLEQLYKVSNKQFLNVILKHVFCTTLNVRVQFCPFAHKMQFDKVSIFTSLQSTFDFILSHSDDSSFASLIFNAMKVDCNTQINSQNISEFDIFSYPVFVSMFELNVYGQIVSDSFEDIQKIIQSPPLFLKDKTIGYIHIFALNKNKTKSCGILNLIGNRSFNIKSSDPPLLMKIEKKEMGDSQFQPLFLKLQHDKIDMIKLIDDNNGICKTLHIKSIQFPNLIPAIKSKEFKEYACKSINNCGYSCLESFEAFINIETWIKWYGEPNLLAAKRISSLYFRIFMPIDDSLKIDSLNYRMSLLLNKDQLFPNAEFIYDEMLITFLAKLIHFQVLNQISENCDRRTFVEAVHRIVPIKNVSFFDEKIEIVNNIVKYSEGMAISDRIIMYGKLLKMIHDLASVQCKNNELYHKLYLLILLSVPNQNEFLSKLFEVFCVFFYLLSNKDVESDDEMNQLKKEWMHFKEILDKNDIK